LTVQKGDEEPDFVSAEGATNGEAKTAAEARIPEGCKAIVIRIDDGSDSLS
jgi:hypothetical protein